jgi:long-chain acyl-CoA synthetase
LRIEERNTLISRETVPGVILEQATRFADRPYLRHWRDGEWRSLSWSEMAELSLRVAAGLVQGGIATGDRVAILAENRYEWLVCDLAIQATGAVTVPIYPTLPPPVVEHILKDSGARVVIASATAQEHKISPGPGAPAILTIETEISAWMKAQPDAAAEFEVRRRLGAVSGDELATIVYTSGTTGPPKGVMLTHRSLVTMAQAALQVFDITETDTVLSYLPYSHVLERIDGVFIPSSAGATLWLARSMDTVMEDIAVAQPTVMLGVPRVFEKIFEAVHQNVAHSSAVKRALFRWAMDAGRRRLAGKDGLEAKLADRLVLRSLRRRLTGGRLRFFISGGAPLNEKVEEFFWAIGVMILQGWGLTESTSGVTSNTETAHRYRTVGQALPGIELKIAPDGEILVRGPAVMKGYLNHPAATAKAIVNGWLRTGDIGFLDGDGFLSITDRKKDLIKTSGGKYIAPLPIESRLQADHLVRAALVIGDGHPYAAALIVPDWELLADIAGIRGNPMELADSERVRAIYQVIVDRCNQGLAGFEMIKRFALLTREFSEELDELTPTLKPKRRVIAAHFEDEIAGLYSAPRAPVAPA